MIALYGRRGLRLAPPGWPAVTLDEIRLLQLFAAAQRGMRAAIQAHLAWLLRPGHAAHPEIAIAHAAETLWRHGLLLPWRQKAAGRPAAGAVAIPAAAVQAGGPRVCD